MSLKNFVIISQYFPPEIGGGSQRSIGFAEELKKIGLNIIIVTPFPSYLMHKDEVKTKLRFFEKETVDGLTVYRTFVYASNRGNFIKRILYYISFTFSAAFVTLIKIHKIDFVLTISPPLFTGIVGLFIKYIKSAYFIFDIGDLWPESAIQLGFLKNKYAIKISEKLERTIYRGSDLLNVVTNQTMFKLKAKYHFIKSIQLVPNFVDTEQIKKKEKSIELMEGLNLRGKIVLGYAGNIGSAQGLKIITNAAKLTLENPQIAYLIIGEGVDRYLIQNEINQNKLKNVILINPVSREKIKDYISLFDAVIISLVKNELFLMTIPSKLYESMAAELPVILCVDGEARRIMEKYDCGLFVEPENATMLAEKINYLYNHKVFASELGKNGRVGAIKEFDRKLVITNFYNKLKLNEKNHRKNINSYD